jgi:hypothetical protein
LGDSEANVEDREGEGNVDEDEEEVADNKACVEDTQAVVPCQFISEEDTSSGGKS